MNAAVLVIDMQKQVYQINPQPFEAEVVIQRINSVCQQARAREIPVVFTRHQVSGFLEPDSDGWQLVDGLQTAASDIYLAKTKGDAFQDSELLDLLQAEDVDSLIIMGFASEICVDSTTRRAAALGYTIQLVADAHTTNDKDHLSAEKIRQHHNLTLAMSPQITIPDHEQVCF